MQNLKKLLGLKAFVAVALVAGIAVTAAWGAVGNGSVNDMYRENLELKQLLAAFGTGSVDVYMSVDELEQKKPFYVNVKMLRPITTFNKPFFRAKDAEGNVWLISPGEITSIKVSGRNFNQVD